MISDYWLKGSKFTDDYYGHVQWASALEEQAASPLWAWIDGQIARNEAEAPTSSFADDAQIRLNRLVLEDHTMRVQVDTDYNSTGNLVVLRWCRCQGDDGIIGGEWLCETVPLLAEVYFDDKKGYIEALAADERITQAVHSTWYWEDQA